MAKRKENTAVNHFSFGYVKIWAETNNMNLKTFYLIDCHLDVFPALSIPNKIPLS